GNGRHAATAFGESRARRNPGSHSAGDQDTTKEIVQSCLMTSIHRIQVIDSHTGGEPTRVVITGGPDLGRGTLSERRERFRQQFDCFRSAIVNEPRGSDVLAGALLCPPAARACPAA